MHAFEINARHDAFFLLPRAFRDFPLWTYVYAPGSARIDGEPTGQ